MVVNAKPTGRAVSIPEGMAWSAGISLSVTLAGTAVAAKLLNSEVLAQHQTGYAAMVILMLASMAGALTAVKKIKRLKLAMCLLSGLVYFLALLAITALFFGGQYSGVGETALLILCGSMVAGMFGKPTSQRTKHPKRKVRNR